MTSAKDFFNRIDLSKLDTATSTLIREDILTLTDNDWDLIDSDSEMQKQMELIKDRIESEFATSISAEPKKEEKELDEKEEFEKQKAKFISDIEEMQMLIELSQDTLKENPNDEDLPMYLELLNDTLQELILSQGQLSKGSEKKNEFEERVTDSKYIKSENKTDKDIKTRNVAQHIKNIGNPKDKNIYITKTGLFGDDKKIIFYRNGEYYEAKFKTIKHDVRGRRGANDELTNEEVESAKKDIYNKYGEENVVNIYITHNYGQHALEFSLLTSKKKVSLDYVQDIIDTADKIKSKIKNK